MATTTTEMTGFGRRQRITTHTADQPGECPFCRHDLTEESDADWRFEIFSASVLVYVDCPACGESSKFEADLKLYGEKFEFVD